MVADSNELRKIVTVKMDILNLTVVDCFAKCSTSLQGQPF